MDLNPCPFCDCEDVVIERVDLQHCDGAYQVGCPDCLACGPANPSEEIAITYWNSIFGRSIIVFEDSRSTDDPHP